MITNKIAYFDYNIEDELEAGIVLMGDEVKAVRANRVSLKGSYAKVFFNDKNKPSFLSGSYFNTSNADPYRTENYYQKSKLKNLVGKVNEKGLTLLPLKMYFKKV